MPKIVITEPMPYLQKELELLKQHAEVVVSPSPDEKDLLPLVGDAEVIMVVYAKISSNIINEAKKLKGIVRYGVGVDNIDITSATSRGVIVCNVPDYAVETVADFTMALMLAVARRIPLADKAMRMRSWGVWTSPPKTYRGVDLSNKTLGVIGLGKIGRAVVRRAAGFNMKIIGYDPYIKERDVESLGVKLVTLDELLSVSDFITIHSPLTTETKHLIGEKEMKKMKKSAYLINTARGAIIDTVALTKALKEGWIAGAALDVYPKEPPAEDDPILDLENVIVTPHIAWYTEEALLRLEMEAVENAIKITRGERPKNVVNPQVFSNKNPKAS